MVATNERIEAHLELCDLQTHVQDYMSREENEVHILREALEEANAQRDNIYDEWVEDETRRGWDEQSSQTQGSSERQPEPHQHLRTLTNCPS
eukprot:2763292-Amphidinium_carterae.1